MSKPTPTPINPADLVKLAHHNGKQEWALEYYEVPLA